MATLGMEGLRFEGNLLVSDLAADLAAAALRGQAAPDFGLSDSDRLKDEIALVWGDARDYWSLFQRRLALLDPTDETATSLTRERWVVPLLRSLGYDPAYVARAEVVDGQTFAISHRAEPGSDRPPVHIIGAKGGLEQRPPSGSPRLSAHALVQDYLNRTEHLWAVVTNGLQWRLLRDSSLMTRLTYVEFDLEQILETESFASFQLFYRLFHRSRLPQDIEDADHCLLEYYHQEAQQQGGRVREKLRDGVERAITTLANGFLQHRGHGNKELQSRCRAAIANGAMSADPPITAVMFYRVVLLIVYRLLFLLVAEDRGLVVADDQESSAQIYRNYYSVERFRGLAERPIASHPTGYQDLWRGLQVTFRLFDENWRGRVLGVSPLNGDLFGADTLALINACGLDNRDVLIAVRSLSLYEDRGSQRRVNYAALDVEELGSVYESLLDLSPQIVQDAEILEFRFIAGGDRKTSGSYYTPQALVTQLVRSALDPVIERSLAGLTDPAARVAALLNLKVCDPACGSGHFLLAAARRIGKAIAQERTGERQPGVTALRSGIREAIAHCLYGVDLNPLAVDLCKVALWIEGFCRGMPLNFLDHRIRCGNALLGVMDLDVLRWGIPEAAYQPVTGDDRAWASKLKRRVRQENEAIAQGQLPLDLALERDRLGYVRDWTALQDLGEDSAAAIKRKEAEFVRLQSGDRWCRDRAACDLWTAAFIMPITHGVALPTPDSIRLALTGDDRVLDLLATARSLSQHHRFFHWPLEFPEAIAQGGFDCVLGNPPWERIKLQEKEFFVSKDRAIATAKNAAARRKLIAQLPTTNPDLDRLWQGTKHFSDAFGKFMRESGRFPLTGRGDINTYAVFAESDRALISDRGYVGIISPTGIATDATTSSFFADLVCHSELRQIFGFQNERFLFPAVDHRVTFCQVILQGKDIKSEIMTFSWFAFSVEESNDVERQFSLSVKDFLAINPNTLTCPIFRTRTDAELTKKIYCNVPVLENERTGEKPWGISFMRMFDMANDSGLFFDKDGTDRIALYEAKMFSHYDHRHSTYKGATQKQLNVGILPRSTQEQKQNPDYAVTPRYWVDRAEVENRLRDRWDRKWLIAFRDITNTTNERTAIFSILPEVGVGNTAPLIFPDTRYLDHFCLLIANFNSLVFDFVARQKMGGTHMTYFILKQLPVLPPDRYSQADIEYIAPRVIELVYSDRAMEPFARDMGYRGPPYRWDDTRRALLRAELDAKYAQLYGLSRDDLRYILDPSDLHGPDFPSETFRVLKTNELKRYGEYLTQRLTLAAYDRL